MKVMSDREPLRTDCGDLPLGASQLLNASDDDSLMGIARQIEREAGPAAIGRKFRFVLLVWMLLFLLYGLFMILGRHFFPEQVKSWVSATAGLVDWEARFIPAIDLATQQLLQLEAISRVQIFRNILGISWVLIAAGLCLQVIDVYIDHENMNKKLALILKYYKIERFIFRSKIVFYVMSIVFIVFLIEKFFFGINLINNEIYFSSWKDDFSLTKTISFMFFITLCTWPIFSFFASKIKEVKGTIKSLRLLP